jgi:hypothetical protein
VIPRRNSGKQGGTYIGLLEKFNFSRAYSFKIREAKIDAVKYNTV